jgi:hypothetical protein
LAVHLQPQAKAPGSVWSTRRTYLFLLAAPGDLIALQVPVVSRDNIRTPRRITGGRKLTALTEHWYRGAGVDGEPVEVFLGELFGGGAGGVDDANWIVAVENRDGQGTGPAGVCAGLREASWAGHHECGLGGAENELYGASVGGRKR